MSIGPSFYIILSVFLGAVPLVIGAGSSFLKISIVLGMIKNAMGLQQTPGGLVVVCLSLALSAFVMGPVVEETLIRAEAVDLKKIANGGAKLGDLDFKSLTEPWRKFLARFSGQKELKVLCEIDRCAFDSARDAESLPLKILLPAFMLSELKASFQLGFTLLLPFLVVDIVIANVLVGLGMYMVSPALISLPIKIILFAASNGWLFISAALIKSYGNQHLG